MNFINKMFILTMIIWAVCVIGMIVSIIFYDIEEPAPQIEESYSEYDMLVEKIAAIDAELTLMNLELNILKEQIENETD